MLTINGGTIQAEPAFRNEYDRLWSQQLGIASTLTDQIRDTVRTLSLYSGEARAERLRWIAQAQEARRTHFRAAIKLGEKARQLRVYRKSQKQARKYRAQALEAAE